MRFLDVIINAILAFAVLGFIFFVAIPSTVPTTSDPFCADTGSDWLGLCRDE